MASLNWLATRKAAIMKHIDKRFPIGSVWKSKINGYNYKVVNKYYNLNLLDVELIDNSLLGTKQFTVTADEFHEYTTAVDV